MLGNVTPDNAKYIKKSILPFASPEIYHQVDDLISLQSANLIEDRISMQFTPENVFVEKGKTFVTGKGEIDMYFVEDQC